MGSMFDCSNNWDLRPYMTTKLPYKYIKKLTFMFVFTVNHRVSVYCQPFSGFVLCTFTGEC